MTRVAAIGECMVELTHRGEDTLALGFAGDTFNTAVYLARSTPAQDVSIDYVTAVGDDWYSERLLAAVAAEGIGTGLVQRVPGHSPGLYLVRTDGAGERSFTYHRSESPARRLFDADSPERIDQAVVESDVVYLSAITLQILSEPARERLWAALAAGRARGGRVVFDSNYRPRGWPTVAAARAAVQRTLQLTDVYLPTFEDEQALFGDRDAQACAIRLAALGITEVVIKNGSDGCLVVAGGEAAVTVPAQSGVAVVDTTAAGDSFNAGYLAARLRGEPPWQAASAGHRLAAIVVGRPGAIVPDEVLPRRELLLGSP
ncbi:sugar kinase [Pseudonocardia bannensis]|uniref:2-dehydro-3-deoxygluconokinase n=1 Tax=Pseudonocardia bannensis TaxID=630973 RepID=A0A848DKM5_9PSEU|nr:sugar kinase [Pseudonocardia bannensis]NMH93280.1 sugar kinase [Pseudonocardia bannensis]